MADTKTLEILDIIDEDAGLSNEHVREMLNTFHSDMQNYSDWRYLVKVRNFVLRKLPRLTTLKTYRKLEEVISILQLVETRMERDRKTIDVVRAEMTKEYQNQVKKYKGNRDDDCPHQAIVSLALWGKLDERCRVAAKMTKKVA